MREQRTRAAAAWLGAALLAGAAAEAGGLELAVAGQAGVDVVVAADATSAEWTAAAELAEYLGRVASARFRVRDERPGGESAPALFVGPTRFAAERGVGCAGMGPEEWFLRAAEDGLILCGGGPRGTLYAVYHFLEEVIGVRWWTPYDEQVPQRRHLRVPAFESGGRPAFVYRDIHGLQRPGRFYARNRVNGHYSRLDAALGGAERYGPPGPVHTYRLYAPPEELFGTHPEFFPEIAGLRFGGQGQLCESNEALAALIAERMDEQIRESRRAAEAAGEEPPRLFDLSRNDWGHACECDRCRALAERANGGAGPLIELVNRVAARIGPEHPDVLIDTLAYAQTLAPPRSRAVAGNVTVRFAALYERDFALPLSAPENREVLEALRGWRERARHLRVWNYAVAFGPDGDLPLPNLSVLAADYRLYREIGVEGIFVQHEFPIAADMRDLKQWVLVKLLEDPERPLDALVEEFTEGYYGRAGRAVRAYLRSLERAARRRPGRIGFPLSTANYEYLDPEFLRRAQRHFERAERAVAGDARRIERVRHARLSLDRATLILGAAPGGGAAAGFDLEAVAERYRATWEAEIERRLPPAERAAARAEVEREIRERLTMLDPRGAGNYPVSLRRGVAVRRTDVSTEEAR